MGANAQTAVPTFTASQVLTAAQQNNSARTGVPVFASTTTRNAAFGGSNKTLAEGQVCYVEGTGLQTYNGSAWVTWGLSPYASAVATVNTEQSTTSTSYTDLATSGPAVTLTTGTKALVLITASSYNSTADKQNFVSFTVSGASTVAVSDDWALLHKGVTSITEVSATRAQLVTGLTAGSNTFTLKYKVSGGTGYFQRRQIAVIDLGS